MTPLLKIDKYHPEETLLNQAKRVLSQGGLLVLPTETVYGLACDPQIPTALDQLIRTKNRDVNKPIARLAGSIEQVIPLTSNWTKGMQALASAFWPGPLTMVLQTPSGWTGFRIPNHAVPLQLAKSYGHPLALTSANISGASDPCTAQEAIQKIQCHLILDSGPSSEQGFPSTVIKVTPHHVECLRKGALPFLLIQETFNRGLL